VTTDLSLSSTGAGRPVRAAGAPAGRVGRTGGGPAPVLPWGRGPGPSGFAACGFDGQLRNAPQARRFVAETLGGWALPDLVPDTQLIVSELITNAVQHALDPVPADRGDYPVWLGIFLHPGDLVCAVTDPSPTPPRPRDASDDAMGGRGLALISALSRTWSWQPTPPRGKTVWATLPLAAPA
jgi:anti-sigma regulatory factor (Ser/Thr protein kinase)